MSPAQRRAGVYSTSCHRGLPDVHLVVFLASPAATTRKSLYYNQPGQKHNDDCVDYTKRAFAPFSAPLRYPDGSKTGLSMELSMQPLLTEEPTTGNNRIRFDAHKELVVRRGAVCATALLRSRRPGVLRR